MKLKIERLNIEILKIPVTSFNENLNFIMQQTILLKIPVRIDQI